MVKKQLVALAALVICGSMLPMSASASIIMGDANSDGEVSIMDVITINKTILGKDELTEEQLKAVDINGNGIPDAEDSLAIMKYIVGLAELSSPNENTSEQPTETTEPTTEELTEATTKEPTEDTTEQPTEDTTEEPTEDTTEQPTEDTTEQPTEDTTEQPTEDTTEEPTEDTTEEPVSDDISILLSDDEITVQNDTASVVSVEGSVVTITASGTYYVTGSITDGQIFVQTAAEDTEDVVLLLSDTTFTNSTKSAIYTSADSGNGKTKIVLIGDNVMTDTAAAEYADGAGVIYSNNKLTFAGDSTGSLTISSYCNTGIYSDKKLNLNGGTITVDTDTAPEDGSLEPDADGIVSGKNIEVEGAVLNLTASGDGLKSKKGSVSILDGDVQIKAGDDAVQAAEEIAISGGDVVACGDRGFRLDENGLLTITGGTVVATATDYQVNGNETIDMSGTTQTTMLFNLMTEYKKSNAIDIETMDYSVRLTYSAVKKYDYVLISDSNLSSEGEYRVYIGGIQMSQYGGDGYFLNTGAVTQFDDVIEIEIDMIDDDMLVDD